jgi:hypothetical protein
MTPFGVVWQWIIPTGRSSIELQTLAGQDGGDEVCIGVTSPMQVFNRVLHRKAQCGE